MEQIALIIFLVTYAGVAIGGIPGLALDRTGIALLGAIAMVVAKVLTTRQAFDAIDTATILLLYALMVISAQFKLSGFYTRVALRLIRLLSRPRLFLLAVMAASAPAVGIFDQRHRLPGLHAHPVRRDPGSQD